MFRQYTIYNGLLTNLSSKKLLINTINAHSFNVANKDRFFKEALLESDILLPDGISIVLATQLLSGKRISKIAGEDLFYYQINKLQKTKGKAFFLGSNESTLNKISNRINSEFPNIKCETYSPPFKSEFSEKENKDIRTAINTFQPDVLFIGMTAPKQEKWAYQHFKDLKVGHVCCIGAVFDFYAGTVNRAPKWVITIGMEWLYRLIKEPIRLWRRYLVGNTRFVLAIFKERLSKNKYL